MTHADFALVPESITTKPEFWDHIHLQLQKLLQGERNWVTNLANASALIYNSLLAFHPFFGPDEGKAVNWCGFYLDSQLFPVPQVLRRDTSAADGGIRKLLLGPFCGRPACQFINIFPKPRGVCANAFIQKKVLLVPDVHQFPGHIACDGDTKSEIVLPLVLKTGDNAEEAVVGVMDLDCLAINGFDADDKSGLEKIAELIVNACDW